MKLPARILVLAVGFGLAAAVAESFDPGTRLTGSVLLCGAVALGELVVLRPPHRVPLPLAYAFMLVLVRAVSPLECIAAIGVAEIVVVPFRPGPWSARVIGSVEHYTAGMAALGAYRLAYVFGGLTPTPRMLSSLAVGGAVALLAHESFAFARTHRTPSVGGADLALIASGMLMAIGFRGIHTSESVGLWSVMLFSIPLLAAWYSFERLAVISRTSEQTIEALSVVPEMAGLANAGHAARVAELSVRVGDELGLRRRDLDDLRAAALLHHLGHLCLDSEAVLSRPIEPAEVADKGAEILRQTDLRHAGDLLATDDPHLGGQILRVVSAFDDLVAQPTPVDVAIDALYSGPGFVYDPRVLSVLERLVGVGAGASSN